MAQRPIMTISRNCFCQSFTSKVAEEENAVHLWLYCVHSSVTLSFPKTQRRNAFVRVECGQYGEYVYEAELWRRT